MALDRLERGREGELLSSVYNLKDGEFIRLSADGEIQTKGSVSDLPDSDRGVNSSLLESVHRVTQYPLEGLLVYKVAGSFYAKARGGRAVLPPPSRPVIRESTIPGMSFSDLKIIESYENGNPKVVTLQCGPERRRIELNDKGTILFYVNGAKYELIVYENPTSRILGTEKKYCFTCNRNYEGELIR